MEKLRCVFRGTQKPKTEKERGKMKGRLFIKAMAYTRPGPSSSNTKKRDFFKIMVGDFQKRLRIPDAFIKLISKELSGRAALEGPSGNCWVVKLSTSKTGTYFKDGWETFQRDHSLTFAEFLVFKYTGDMNFKVLIFGINGCERRDTFVVEPSQGKLMSSRRPERLILAEEETPYVSPQFPSVMCKMAPSYLKHPFTLTLPAKFAREHLPRTTTMVRLHDKKGKKWKIKLQVLRLRSMLSVGWKRFVEDNCLKVGDTCRFQLVREAVMKVKIYRC